MISGLYNSLTQFMRPHLKTPYVKQLAKEAELIIRSAFSQAYCNEINIWLGYLDYARNKYCANCHTGICDYNLLANRLAKVPTQERFDHFIEYLKTQDMPQDIIKVINSGTIFFVSDFVEFYAASKQNMPVYLIMYHRFESCKSEAQWREFTTMHEDLKQKNSIPYNLSKIISSNEYSPLVQQKILASIREWNKSFATRLDPVVLDGLLAQIKCKIYGVNTNFMEGSWQTIQNKIDYVLLPHQEVMIAMTVSDGNLMHISTEISAYIKTNLVYLDLRNNELKSVPPCIGLLRALQYVDLRENPINQCIEPINHPKMTKLLIDRNKRKYLPLGLKRFGFESSKPNRYKYSTAMTFAVSYCLISELCEGTFNAKLPWLYLCGILLWTMGEYQQCEMAQADKQVRNALKAIDGLTGELISPRFNIQTLESSDFRSGLCQGINSYLPTFNALKSTGNYRSYLLGKAVSQHCNNIDDDELLIAFQKKCRI